MKKVQRINESQLRAIVAESVKKVLNENLRDDRDNDNVKKSFYAWMQPMFSGIEEIINGHFEDQLKGYGYTRSYKRFMKAKEVAYELMTLLSAIEQDVTDEHVHRTKRCVDYPTRSEDGYFGTDGISVF